MFKNGKYIGYIYKITCLINNKIYIGQTIQTPQKRFQGHISESKRENTSMVIAKAIRKYGKENFKIEQIAMVIENTQDLLYESLNQLERECILKYKSTDRNIGYNIDDGGHSGTIAKKAVDIYYIDGTFIETVDSRRKASELYNINEDDISAVCNGHMGNIRCEYVFRDVGVPFDYYSIESPYYKLIYRFTLDGKDMTTFYSNVQAMNSVGLTYISPIMSALDNPHMQIKGYWWSTKPEFNYQGWKNKRKVDLYNATTLEFIDTYDSVSECARQISVSSGDVSAMCNGERITAKGYITRYYGDNLYLYPIEPQSDFGRKKVNQYKGDVYIQTFESIKSANEAMTNKTTIAIKNCCLKKPHYNTAFGYKWFYADDPNQPDKTKIITNSEEKSA